MDIVEQLKRYVAWAHKTSLLSAKFGESMRQENRRLRPSVGGFSLVSYHPATPQLGFADLREESDLVRDLHRPLSPPGRPTPEKDMQSFLIHEAFGSAGRVPSLEAVLGADIWFVTDELSFTNDGVKLVVNLLLVIVRSGLAELYPAELKYERKMSRVFGQVMEFRPLIEDLQLRDHWRVLAETLTGQKFKWADVLDGSHSLVVWPRSKNPTASEARRRRAEYPRVDAIGYEKDGRSQFLFSIEWRADERPLQDDNL